MHKCCSTNPKTIRGLENWNSDGKKIQPQVPTLKTSDVLEI